MGYKEIGTLMLTPFEYSRDFLRMLKWSKASPFCELDRQVRYEILLLAHTVEKGLSATKPRPAFGALKIRKLLQWLSRYDPKWGTFPMEKSYGCLLAYLAWNDSIGADLGVLRAEIQKYIDRCVKLDLRPRGGVKEIAVANLAPNSIAEDFLLSRFSSRRFADSLVSDQILLRISEIARRSPSQCNRQSARIHYYSKPAQIDALLRLQGGAEEFRSSVKNLFVVSSEISAWSGYKARSQAYVDGALLAMQVLNACQALGLVACPLNLAVSNRREHEICDAGGISKGERLIVMIAFGAPLPGEFVAARSERIQTDEIMTRH